jgi:hypothetical protein
MRDIPEEKTYGSARCGRTNPNTSGALRPPPSAFAKEAGGANFLGLRPGYQSNPRVDAHRRPHASCSFSPRSPAPSMATISSCACAG